MKKLSKILLSLFLISLFPTAFASGTGPTASISVSPSTGSLETVFVFDASDSIDSRGFSNTLEYRWNFDSGVEDWTEFDTDSTVTHQYSSDGTKEVRVEVRDSDGNTDQTWTEVKVEDDFPYEADFSVNPEEGTTETTFEFDITVTSNVSVSLSDFEYRWDFEGDGEWDTGNTGSETMEHVYGTSGTYRPILEVSAPDGTTMTISGYKTDNASSGGAITVTSESNEPEASIKYYPNSGSEDTRFYFSAEDSFDSDDYYDLEYRWDYQGDGIFDTDWSDETDTDYKYGIEGNYEVILQVRDSDGYTDEARADITVSSVGFPPEAKFTVTSDSQLADKDVGTTATNFTFNASSSSDNEDGSSTIQVRWDYEGNGDWDTSYSTNKYAYHQYLETGEYDVMLEVMDNDGNTSTTTYSIRVIENTAPNASFEVNQHEATPGVEFEFDAGACSDDQYKPYYLEVRWDFEGDGVWDTDFSTTKSTSHYYDESGEYDAIMQVKDPEGQTAEASEEITVLSNSAPISGFTVTPDEGTYSTNFYFDGSYSHDVQTDSSDLWYRWDFNYNGTSDLTYDTSWTHTSTVYHYFSTDEGVGDINVKIEVKDADGEISSTVKKVYIHWASPYLEELKDDGIMRGYSGDMKPDQNITRAELLKIVLEGTDVNLNGMTYKGYFTDVKSSDWSWKYVEKAYEMGIITGYTDGSFKPNQNINRAEALKIVLEGFEIWIDTNYEYNIFDDVNSGSWYFDYVMTAYENDLVSGYGDGSFGPANYMTRGEAAKVVWTAME